MKRQTALTHFAIVLVAVMLTACGFRLRGSALQDDMPFKSIYVKIANSSPFGVDLKRSLRAGGTTVTSDPKDAEVILEVLSENKSKNILSLNAEGRAREYGLTYSVGFRALDGKRNVILAPTSVTQNRTLTYSEAEAQAKEIEQENLYQNMQFDLANQMMRRLSALKLDKPE